MKKSGRTTAGSQRWKCTACALSSTAVRRDRARDFQLREFLDWLLTGRIQEQMGPTGARAFRKRVGWCWNIAPAIEPDGVVHHTVMADGTCTAHGWCLIIAIDGASGQVIDWQWCHHENTAAYTALFGRIPRPRGGRPAGRCPPPPTVWRAGSTHPSNAPCCNTTDCPRNT